MRVSDILRTKGATVCTIDPDATIADALASLNQYGIGAIVVSSTGTSVDGILSERDIVRALHSDGDSVTARLVRDIMTSNVVTCTPADQVDNMMSLMSEKRFRHVPVVETDTLVGIVSIGDVVASRLTELERETEALEGYIRHGR